MSAGSKAASNAATVISPLVDDGVDQLSLELGGLVARGAWREARELGRDALAQIGALGQPPEPVDRREGVAQLVAGPPGEVHVAKARVELCDELEPRASPEVRGGVGGQAVVGTRGIGVPKRRRCHVGVCPFRGAA
jgi:hypothetical protein